MLELQFEIGGRKLDPCFIGDGIEKATLLNVARRVKEQFSVIRVTDREDPLRVLIKGADVEHLHCELVGSPDVLNQVREKMGIVPSGEIPIAV